MITDVATAPAARPKSSLQALIERERRRKRHRRHILAAAVAALVALAVLAAFLLRPAPKPLSARFRTRGVDRGDVLRDVHATGNLEAVTTVDVGAEISGRIAEVEVDYNDHVEAGQVMARFDRAALEANRTQVHATLAAAVAALEQAKTDRERSARDQRRIDEIFAERGISQVERDNAHTASRLAQQRVEAAEAEVLAQRAANQLAETNLSHTVIYAPIAGVVITRNIDPGQTVAATLQAPVLFTVAADLRKMRVIAAVDEADVGEVAVGQSASFTVNAYPERSFSALVTKVRYAPKVIQDVVTYGTELEVDNKDLALKPGMTASVRIRTASAYKTLRVPVFALSFTPPGERATNTPAVWVLEGEALRRVSLGVGINDGELAEIHDSALAPGQQVLVELTPAGRTAYGIAN